MPPGGVILSRTRQVDPVQGSEGPPTGFLDTLGAGTRVAMDSWSDSIEGRKHVEYEALIKALEERGVKRSTLDKDRWVSAPGPFGIGTIYAPQWGYDPQKVFDAAVKAGMKLPKTREEFERNIITRNGERLRDLGVLARGTGIGAALGAIAGQSAADMADSDLGPFQFMVGGGAKTLAQAFLREGVINLVQEAVKQPERIQNRQQLGEQTTATEVAMDLGGSFVFGGLLGAAGKYAGDKFDAFGGWGALKSAPRDVQERVWAAILDRTPGLREKVGAKVDWSALDPHLADIAEATIDRTRMTDAERGAINALRREAATDAGNPFVPDGAGTESHYRLLGEALQGIINDTPVYVPKGLPSLAARLRSGTSIASGVTGDVFKTVKARIGVVEYGNGQVFRNPRSSAEGLYQFTDGTWLAYYKARYGSQGLSRAAILAKKRDVDVQNRLMDDLMADNAKALQDAGFAVDPGNIYLAHFAGRKGAIGLLEADPATPAVRILGEKVIQANPFLRGKTAGEVITWAHGKMGGRTPAMPASAARGEAGDVMAALDQEMASTQAELARLDSEIAAGTRGVTGALDDVTPEAVPVADAAPLARIEATDGQRVPLATAEGAGTGRAEVAGMTPEARAIMPQLKGIVQRERDVSLNDPVVLSARLGVDERSLRAALQQMAIDGLVVQKRDGSFTRLPRPKDGPMDVLAYVASTGGVTPKGFSQSLMAIHANMAKPPKGHDLGRIFAVEREVRWRVKPDPARGIEGVPLPKPQRQTRSALIPGYGPIVRSTGRGLDEIGEDLWEAGYFGVPDSVPRPTENDVINLLQEAFGSGKKVYSIYDQTRAAELEAEKAARYADPRNPFASDFQSEEHYLWEFRQFDHEAFDAFGIALDDEGFIAAWGEYRQAGDGDIRGAVLRSVQREIEDVQAREIAERGIEDAEDIIAEWEAALRGDGFLGGEEGARPYPEPGDPGPDAQAGWTPWREDEGPLDPEAWQGWDEPDGEAAQITADSMEHDLRVQVGDNGQMDFAAPTGAQVRTALERQTEGGIRPKGEQKAPGSDGGLFDTRDTTGNMLDTGNPPDTGTTIPAAPDLFDGVAFRLDENGDVVNPADLLAEFDVDAAFLKTIRDCL